MKKAVIIGSGLGGLSSGVVLAKNGYDVTVLEQDGKIGGCLQCFRRNNVKFEPGMHFIGSADRGQILNKMLRYLEIDDKVPLSRLDTERYNVVSLGGERFEFANGKDRFIEKMAGYFPGQKDNIAKYFDIISRISDSSSLHSLKAGNSYDPLISEYQLRSINDVIGHIVTDPVLQNVLVGDLPLYAAVRDKTPFSIHAFIMDFYNRSAFRFVGGSDTVAESLAGVLSKYGGKTFVNSKATRIICDGSRATKVEVNGESLVEADYVISAVHPARTMEMLEGVSMIRPAFRKRISSIPQTIGVFSVYMVFKENAVPYMNCNFFGYDGDTPWGCETYDSATWPKGYLYMHICDRQGQEFANGGVILTYMREDELGKWEHTVTGRRGADYEKFMRERAEILISSVEKDFPGLKDKISSFYMSSPLTYRDYTGTEKGSVYGVARDISLGAAGRVPHKTRIPNVFMAGQNVNSHGMLGVIVGTMVACGELLSPEYIYEQIIEAGR